MTPDKKIEPPPLPKPGSVSITNDDPGCVELRDNFTARQMRDYVAADRAQRQAEPGDFDTWMKNPYTLVLNKSIAEDYVPRHVQECQAGQEPVAVVVIDYTGGPQRPTAEFVGGFLPDGTKLYAAPQPAQVQRQAEQEPMVTLTCATAMLYWILGVSQCRCLQLAQLKSGKHLSNFLTEASKSNVTHLNFDIVPPAPQPAAHLDKDAEIEKAVLAERERCALLAEAGFRFAKDAYAIADDIRQVTP